MYYHHNQMSTLRLAQRMMLVKNPLVRNIQQDPNVGPTNEIVLAIYIWSSLASDQTV